MKNKMNYLTTFVVGAFVFVLGVSQSSGQDLAESPVILESTPRSVQDLLALEKKLKDVLPRVLPALVCIQLKDSSGSGAIVTETGEIYSAAHVVNPVGTTFKIVLQDGTELAGKTSHYDADSDAGIAMVTETKLLKSKPLPTVPRAKGLPEIGEWVFALGHGGGLDKARGPMVRLGRVVSLKGGVIKSDCKLIRGDSGGPLFNLKGELLGAHSRVGTSLEDNVHLPMSMFDDLKKSPPTPASAKEGDKKVMPETKS